MERVFNLMAKVSLPVACLSGLMFAGCASDRNWMDTAPNYGVQYGSATLNSSVTDDVPPPGQAASNAAQERYNQIPPRR